MKKCKTVPVIVLLAVFLLPVFFSRAAEEPAPAPDVTVVDIGISPEDYEALIGDSNKEKIFSVPVQIGGVDCGKARLNIRGCSSLQVGQLTKAKRIPLEITFSTPDIFPGLENKSVKLINSLTPYRLVAEYLALELFESCGVPTPAHAFAFIRMNGVDLGLYIAVEDLNKAFLEKSYGSPVSALYKATTDPSKADRFINSVWFGHLFQKGKASSDTLTLLLDALDAGEGYEQYIDMEQWARYFACVAVTGGDGSIFTECNNFALYDNGGRFDLLPWDLSEAFSGRRTGNSIDRYYINDDPSSPNPLFDLLMKNGDFRERYHVLVREYAEAFYEPGSLDARYEAILDTIGPYLGRDRSMLLNSVSALEELRSEGPDSLMSLRYTLGGLYENLIAQCDGAEMPYFANEALEQWFYWGENVMLGEIEEASPLYDPDLPRKIEAAYPQWQAGRGGSPGRAALWLIAGGAAAVLPIVIISFHRRKK